MKIRNYYLDLEKVNQIKSVEDRQQIHDYYRDMMLYNYDGREDIALSIMLTLINSGYLTDGRDRKIDQALLQHDKDKDKDKNKNV